MSAPTLIGAVEDAILAAVKDLAGGKLRELASLPAPLDLDELTRRLKLTPAVYVAFLGGTPKDENGLTLDAEFGVFFLVGAADEKQRRRGDGAKPGAGAYALMEAVLPQLHGLVVPGCGSLTCTGVHNLFSEALDAKGVSLYSGSYRLPVTLPRFDAARRAALADFLTFHADWIVPGHEVPPQGTKLPYGDADVSDNVTLPQS